MKYANGIKLKHQAHVSELVKTFNASKLNAIDKIVIVRYLIIN